MGDGRPMGLRSNVNHVKQTSEKKSRGRRLLVNSLIVGGVGVAPLLLYILLGPADGNPIGLGLLAVLGMAVAIIGGFIGTVTLILEYLHSRRG